MPNRPQKTSRAVRLRSTPLLARVLWKPSKLKITLTSTMTARFVAKKENPHVCCSMRAFIMRLLVGSAAIVSSAASLSSVFSAGA